MFLVYLLVSSAFILVNANNETKVGSCSSEIYCVGDLLKTVQTARVFDDPKTFVDMSARYSADKVLKNFKDMMAATKNKPSRDKVRDFVNNNFMEESKLESWTPTDFKQTPAFLELITTPKVRKFAEDIIALWPRLGRKVNDDVATNPDQHSVIHMPNGFIMPGGKYQGLFYWDSYWIMQGLFVSEMYSTCKGMIENFLYLIDKYGLVPIGNRVYYLNRSQPPLLMRMVKDYIDTSNQLGWLKKNIHILAKECEFWFNNKFITVKVGGKKYKMATYALKSIGPRPEYYLDDVRAASMYGKEEDKQKLYNELKGAAESGWDFSSRWIFDKSGSPNANISYTVTSRVIPVDLNAILSEAFRELGDFYNLIGNDTVWQARADELNEAIQNVLWDEEDGIWYDFDVKTGTRRKMFAASNLTPLWSKAYDLINKEAIGEKVANYLKKEKITDFEGGIPATKIDSNQLWDMPNAWPNLQSIMVYGLRNTDQKQAVAIAKDILRWWVSTNILAFEKDKVLYDKYDAKVPGKHGGNDNNGIETRYAWTSGVALDLINLYYSDFGGGNVRGVSYILFCLVLISLIIIN